MVPGMPTLAYTTFDGVLHKYELKEGTTRVGRTEDNDLQIDELAVSSSHCELVYERGVITVRDLDSVAGTCVEGEPIEEAPIAPGQILSLGTFLIDVLDERSPRQARGAEPLSPSQLDDGSYSCLRHKTTRALYECDECFDLACEDCIDHDKKGEPICSQCNHPSEAIDWSGLTMTKKEAIRAVLPEKLQRALQFWERRKESFEGEGQA